MSGHMDDITTTYMIFFLNQKNAILKASMYKDLESPAHEATDTVNSTMMHAQWGYLSSIPMSTLVVSLDSLPLAVANPGKEPV